MYRALGTSRSLSRLTVWALASLDRVSTARPGNHATADLLCEWLLRSASGRSRSMGLRAALWCLPLLLFALPVLAAPPPPPPGYGSLRAPYASTNDGQFIIGGLVRSSLAALS